MNEVDRGFEGILLACSRDPDPIFFDCPPRCFPNSDGTYTIYEIKNGVFKTDKCVVPIEPPSITNEKIVEIEDRVISGSIDESMTSQILYISDHIAQLTANYFKTIVVHIKLIFGINENETNSNSETDSTNEEDVNNPFVILDGSTVVTLKSQTNAQISRPEISSLVAKVMSSNKNSNNQEVAPEQTKIIIDENRKNKKHIHKRSYYASDSLSVTEKDESEEDIDEKEKTQNEQSDYDSVRYFNPDSQILYAIDNELNREIDYSSCITNSPQCGPPKYQIKRIVVALYNLHSLFPHYGDSELYYQIKLKAPHLTEKVPCCVQCYHLYLAAERVCRACKQSYPLTFDLQPKPFQPLVATELKKRGKMPLNSTTLQKNEPHSFILNIINSPYKEPAFLIPEPQKIANGKKKNSTMNMRKRTSYSSYSRCSSSYSTNKRESTPSWVSRLTGDDSDSSSYLNSRGGMRNMYISSLTRYKAANVNDLPYYLTPVGYSETLAPDNYGRPPFDIAKLDPKRKRKIHIQKKKNTSDFF